VFTVSSLGTDFECRSKSTHYVCNETRSENELQNSFEKQEDDWCKENREQCNGECVPGYLKCMIYNHPSCANPEEYVKCGDECRKSRLFYDCDGTCIRTNNMCNGLCADGFREYKGKCVLRSDPNYFYECDGEFIDLETPCNGLCNGYRKMCRGERCLESWESEECDGECIHLNEMCNGTCKPWMFPCGDRCVGQDIPCEGRCLDDQYPFLCMGHSGETCIRTEHLRNGVKDCTDGSDETTNCLQGRRCNGTVQCVNKPCHDHGPGEKKCPETVKRASWTTDTYKMYYCEAEDECKLEGVPCGGKCLVEMETDHWMVKLKAEHQFACHDGSKCVRRMCDNNWQCKQHKIEVCNGINDCPDGSDEICECVGDIDCKDRIHVNPIDTEGWEKLDTEFVCKSGDERVKLFQYCNGVVECRDGSDEEGCAKCPGLTRCKNGLITCANVPCNNTDTSSTEPDLTCEHKSIGAGKWRQTGHVWGGEWRLCKEQDEEAKCVKVSYMI
jgi:hypothetical protein